MSVYIVKIGDCYVGGVRSHDKQRNVSSYIQMRHGGDFTWVRNGKFSICLTADKDNALRLLGYLAGSISYHFNGEALQVGECS